MDNLSTTFAKIMAETTLEIILWQKIKKDWWEPIYQGQLYIDEDEKTLAVMIDEKVALLNFSHIYHDIEKSEHFQDLIQNHITKAVAELKQIAAEHTWNDYKIIIVTTYKLSNYKNMNFSSIPSGVNYFFMTEFPVDSNFFNMPETPEVEIKDYEMRLDQDIMDFKSGDDMLKYLLYRGKKLNSKPDFWKCEICSGNENTGCLYFDSTECPKFT